MFYYSVRTTQKVDFLLVPFEIVFLLQPWFLEGAQVHDRPRGVQFVGRGAHSNHEGKDKDK